MTYKKQLTAESTAQIMASLGANDIEVSIPTDASAAQVAPVASAPTAFVQKKGISGSGGVTTSVEDRALSLLGSGIAAEQVAAALGVTPSRIAQLLSTEVFSRQVADLRYTNLQKHNVRDEAYDNLEDRLLTKLNNAMPLLMKPRDIIDALTKVNAAKRRGQSAPAQVNNQQNVVNLILPAIIVEKFAIDINNQVTRAGKQDLLTMQSGNLLKQVEDATAKRLENLQEPVTNGLQEEHSN
jgi:hypothetical protein